MAGRGVGAAWYRLLHADDPGYGFVAAGIPEITLGVASQVAALGFERVGGSGGSVTLVRTLAPAGEPA